METPGRNEPCPCGSGRRYKRCCEVQDRAARKRRKKIVGIVLAVVIVGGLAFALERVRRGASSDGSSFRYDAVNDRYWHPEHGHWHDGPPPDFDTSQLDPADLPEPWQYDADKHRFWHADHGHWHNGFPPGGNAVGTLRFPGQEPPAPPPAPPPTPPPANTPAPTIDVPPESIQE